MGFNSGLKGLTCSSPLCWQKIYWKYGTVRLKCTLQKIIVDLNTYEHLVDLMMAQMKGSKHVVKPIKAVDQFGYNTAVFCDCPILFNISISLFALRPEHFIQCELWCKMDGAWFRPLTSNEVTSYTVPSEYSLSYRWQIRRSDVRCGCCCFRHPRQGQDIKVNNKQCGGQWPLTGCWSPIHNRLRPCGCRNDSMHISTTVEQI